MSSDFDDCNPWDGDMDSLPECIKIIIKKFREDFLILSYDILDTGVQPPIIKEVLPSYRPDGITEEEIVVGVTTIEGLFDEIVATLWKEVRII